MTERWIQWWDAHAWAYLLAIAVALLAYAWVWRRK